MEVEYSEVVVCSPDVPLEYHPVPGDCHSFYVCVSGTMTEYKCNDNMVFYPYRNKCDYNDGSIYC